MHDHSCDVVGLFFGWLHHLSRPSRRKIFGIHRLDRRGLLPDTGFARSACLCDVAPGDFDAYPGFSPQMGPAQTDRALDDPDLALRLCHRRVCLFNALQMVSTGSVTQAIFACDRLGSISCLKSAAERSGDRPSLKSTQRGLSAPRGQSCARQLFDV